MQEVKTMATITETTDRARELQREYMREWRKAHREHTRAYCKQWRQKNRERCKEYQRRYWEKRADKDLQTLASSIREEQGGND